MRWIFESTRAVCLAQTDLVDYDKNKKNQKTTKSVILVVAGLAIAIAKKKILRAAQQQLQIYKYFRPASASLKPKFGLTLFYNAITIFEQFFFSRVISLIIHFYNLFFGINYSLIIINKGLLVNCVCVCICGCVYVCVCVWCIVRRMNICSCINFYTFTQIFGANFHSGCVQKANNTIFINKKIYVRMLI
jgi:hypothetical protein